MRMACRSGNNAGRTPTFHSGIEIKPKKVLEGYYVNCSLVVGTNCLDAGGHYNVDPRSQHCFQVANSDFFVDGRQVEAKAAGSLSYYLPPTLPQRSLDGEDDRVRRVYSKMFD